MWAQCSCLMNPAHPLLIQDKGNIGSSENCDKEPPVLVAMGMDVPGFGWGGTHLKCKDPECNRMCDCCDEEMTQDDVGSRGGASRVR